MFVGDHILGTPQVVSIDLSQYMKSLYKMRNYKADKYALSHSTELVKDEILVDAKSKLEAYISFREKKEEEVKMMIKYKLPKYFTKYDAQHA